MSASGFASLALLACSEGLVDSSYRGEPLFEMSGQVLVDADSPPGDGIRISFKWLAPDGTDRGAETPEALTTRFPAQYWLALFVPPPDEAFKEATDAAPAHALSRPILFGDRNGNDLWDPREEHPVGDGGEVHLIWLEEALGELPAGYSLVEELSQPPDLASLVPLEPENIDLYVYEVP